MGTNFYAVLPVKNRNLINKEINKLINLAKDEDDFSLVKEVTMIPEYSGYDVVFRINTIKEALKPSEQ